MATLPQYDCWEMPVTSSADLAKHLRVKLDGNSELELAGAADAAIGFLTERGAEQTFAATVRKYNAPSVVAVASGVIAAGAEVFAAAGGKVSNAGTVSLGQALTPAAADNDLIVLIPHG